MVFTWSVYPELSEGGALYTIKGSYPRMAGDRRKKGQAKIREGEGTHCAVP